MTLDREDIEAIAEATALKLVALQSQRLDADHMARLILSGRSAEVKAAQREKLRRQAA